MPDYKRARHGTTYFFTVVTYERNTLFNKKSSVDALMNIVREVRMNYPFDIDAFVTLPDHVHCIWTLPVDDTDYSKRWSMIKRKFTQYVNDLVHTEYSAEKINTVCTVHSGHNNLVRTDHSACLDEGCTMMSRTKRREGFVWQRRFWEHQIRDDRDYQQHCDYIHYNPVKHGLINAPKDWRFSTFHDFVNNGFYQTNWGMTAEMIFAGNVGNE